jgi:hypothetical protein
VSNFGLLILAERSGEDFAFFPTALARLAISAPLLLTSTLPRGFAPGTLNEAIFKYESVEFIALGVIALAMYLIVFGVSALLIQPD